jgi:quercetin dioxygenase-like cupin family protein
MQQAGQQAAGLGGGDVRGSRLRPEYGHDGQGLARITIEDDVKTIEMNESVYIPLGARHRLENPGDTPLHVIEVQTGKDFSEDDIIRYADRYGRD